MAYTQTLFDDFNDNSISGTKWSLPTAGATETSQKMNMPCTAAYPQLQGQTLYNLSSGILAVKYAKTGTVTAQSEFYIGAHDGAGNYVSIFGSLNGATMTWEFFGAATFSSAVYTDTTVGMGPSWTGGTWLGLGNLGSDNVLRLYKSTDGQTWTEMARCTVGGTFGKTTTGFYFMSGTFSGSSTLVNTLDDASYWANGGSGSAKKGKARIGGAWVSGQAKVRVGGAWVACTPKVRVGGAWVIPK